MLLLECKTKALSYELIDFLIENDMECIIKDLKNYDGSKNYFDLSHTDKSKISYLKGDRIPEDETLIYDREYRENKAYHTKIGKLLSDKIDQCTVQKISKILYARQHKDQFTIKISNDIVYYYNEDNYSEDHGINGQLHSSCMRYESLSSAISLYEKIGNKKVQLLIALDHNNKLVGRSLLWHNVENNDKKIEYLDRVYSANDNITQLFSDYADQNNLVKYGESQGNLKVHIHIDEDDYIPYFDTFSNYSYDGFISSYGGDVEFESTEGESLEDINGQSCGECGNRYHRDELSFSDCEDQYLCNDCGVYIDDINDCISIGEAVCINGAYYHNESEDICYSEYENEHLLKDDAVYSESESDYFSSDSEDIVWSEHHEDYLLKENTVHSDYHNDYFESNEVTFSEYHEDYLLESDNDIVFSKFHNDLLIKSDNEVIFIESENDYFLAFDECIVYDDKKKEYSHRQAVLAL